MSFYLSIIAFALLFTTSAIENIAITFILFIYFTQNKNNSIPNCISISNNKIPTILILLWLGITFIFRWRESPKPIYIADSLGIDIDVFLTITAIALSAIAYNSIYRLVYIVKYHVANQPTNHNLNTRSILYLFVIATIAITLFSHCSPIYPFQTWCDPNFFFTVGKSVINGVVPYRDLYEQKGPLLYFIHTLAATISYRTFIGVYLIEIIIAWFYLLISYKTISLFCINRKILIICAPLCMIAYSSIAFYMGDTAEEFCLPCIAYALFIGLKTIRNKQSISFSEAFFVGVTAACVLWIKFSLCGFYLGWIGYLLYVYFKCKWGIRIIPTFIYAIIGLITLSIPILIYFSYHDALYTMIETYFINNSTLYGDTSNSICTLLKNIFNSSVCNFVWLLIIAGIFVSKKHNCLIYFLSTLCCLLSAIYIRISFVYYTFILVAFAPVGISIFCNFSKRAIYLIVALFIMSVFSNSMLYTPKENLAQHKFEQIINLEHNPTLLNYQCRDDGFYTYSGIVPINRFFGMLNIPHPEMKFNQDSIVSNGLTTFIITQRLIGMDEESRFPKYEKIAEAPHYGEKWEADVIYSLYKLKTDTTVAE